VELKVLKALKALKALQVLLVPMALQVLLVPMAQSAIKVLKAPKVLKALKAHKVHQVLKVLKAHPDQDLPALSSLVHPLILASYLVLLAPLQLVEAPIVEIMVVFEIVNLFLLVISILQPDGRANVVMATL